MDELFSKPKDFKKALRQVTSLHELEYSPKQIRNNTFIKLTINSEGARIASFQTSGVDAEGNEVRLSFYNLPTTGTAGTWSGPVVLKNPEKFKEYFSSLGNSVFKPGTVIFIRDPWLKFAMDGGSTIRVEDSKDIAIVRDSTCCYNCSKFENEVDRKLSRCDRCAGAFYCSRDCQKAHWKMHKKVCFDYDTNKSIHS